MAAKCICGNVWRVHIGFDSEVAEFARVDLCVSMGRKDLNKPPTTESVRTRRSDNERRMVSFDETALLTTLTVGR